MSSSEKCHQCGWPFDSEALQSNACKKCRRAIDRPAIQKIIICNAEILRHQPGDPDALLNMGLCYLRLGLYDVAESFFGRLIDAQPEAASGYYYKAIGSMKGRRPRVMMLDDIRTAEQLLLTAMSLEPDNGRYDVVLAAMRHDYYVMNGLRVPEPRPGELLERAQGKYLNHEEVALGLALMSIPEFSFGAAIFTGHI